MRKVALFAIATFCGASLALGGDVSFELTIKGGKSEPEPPKIVIAEPPVFLVPAPLGFQVAVGIPYDMFLISGSYYIFYGNVWYVAPSYNGPWRVIKYKNLPPGLRRQKYEDIIVIRDKEYKNYINKKGQGQGLPPGHGKEKHKGWKKGKD